MTDIESLREQLQQARDVLEDIKYDCAQRISFYERNGPSFTSPGGEELEPASEVQAIWGETIEKIDAILSTSPGPRCTNCDDTGWTYSELDERTEECGCGQRPHLEQNTARVNLPDMEQVLKLWRACGGGQHGPRTETVTMPLSKFEHFCLSLLAASLSTSPEPAPTPPEKESDLFRDVPPDLDVSLGRNRASGAVKYHCNILTAGHPYRIGRAESERAAEAVRLALEDFHAE